MCSKNKEYAILGGSGLAIELAEYMLTEGYNVCGYYAPQEDTDSSSMMTYLGDERKKFSRNLNYVIGAGLIALRLKMISFLESNDLETASFISNRAYVSSLAKIGKGAVILPFAVVSGHPTIGKYILMNYMSNVAHHAIVGDNVVLAPGARVNGHCSLGNNVTMGANSALVPGTKLGDGIEIGISTFTRKNVNDNVMVINQPGREIPNFKNYGG